jgi:hypothetical protein
VPISAVFDTNVNFSIDGEDHLPMLKEIIDWGRPEVEFISNIKLQEATLSEPNAGESLSLKSKAIDPSIFTGKINNGVSSHLNNYISGEDNVKIIGKIKSSKNVNKPYINVPINFQESKAKVSISRPSGKKNSNRDLVENTK